MERNSKINYLDRTDFHAAYIGEEKQQGLEQDIKHKTRYSAGLVQFTLLNTLYGLTFLIGGSPN